MWTEALYHGAARIASAACSFLLFALVARRCSTESAKAVFFFSFALGFLIVTLRTFGTLAAGLAGGWRRARKLRAVVRVTGHLLALQLVAAAAALLVFRTHPVPAWLVLAACATVVLASFDSDLLRASLNRRSSFSVAFALGGVLAVSAFAAGPRDSVTAGCLAVLLQWVPVIALNLYLYGRLLLRRGRLAALLARLSWGGVLGPALVATFDGFVLNAPFLLGARIEARAGVDLSVATRLFVSSLPLFPLVMHWSNSGTLARMAARVRLREPQLYAGLIGGSGWVGGALLGVLFVVVSGKDLTARQYLLSVALLLAYAWYAARIRYDARAIRTRRKLAALVPLLAAFLGVYLALGSRGTASAALLVGLEAGTLLAAGAALALLRRVEERHA